MEKLTKTYKSGTGKRISLEELFNYIEVNKKSLETVGCIDLNEVNNTEQYDELEQLKFQDIKKISNLPDNLSSIFKINNLHKYIHIGILQQLQPVGKYNKYVQFNVSLFSSVFTCLKQSFTSEPINFQNIFITKFIDRFLNSSKGEKFRLFQYKQKYNWNSDDLYYDIANGVFNSNVLKYLSDYLHINIFLLDIQNDILSYCGGELYVSFKKTIFLLKYNEMDYEPFFTDKNRTFSTNDDIIKNIKNKELNSFVNVLQISTGDIKNIEFIESVEDLYEYGVVKKNRESKKEVIDNKIIEKKEKIENQEQDNEFNETDIEETEKMIVKDLSEKDSEDCSSESESGSEEEIKKSNSKINKNSDKKKYKISDIKQTMKLDELQKIAKNLNIKITDNKKTKTKKDLINEIKEKLDCSN